MIPSSRGVGRCGIKTKASQKVWGVEGVEAWAGQVEACLVGGSDWKDGYTTRREPYLFLAVVYRHLRQKMLRWLSQSHY